MTDAKAELVLRWDGALASNGLYGYSMSAGVPMVSVVVLAHRWRDRATCFERAVRFQIL